jgi:hypothetical protein
MPLLGGSSTPDRARSARRAVLSTQQAQTTLTPTRAAPTMHPMHNHTYREAELLSSLRKRLASAGATGGCPSAIDAQASITRWVRPRRKPGCAERMRRPLGNNGYKRFDIAVYGVWCHAANELTGGAHVHH